MLILDTCLPASKAIFTRDLAPLKLREGEQVKSTTIDTVRQSVNVNSRYNFFERDRQKSLELTL